MTHSDMKWRDAIITVLQDADGAMHYTEIAEEIAKRKLRKNLGATPAATVASMVSTSNKSGEDSPFLKTEPGRVMFNPQWVGALTTDTPDIAPAPEPEDIPVVKAVGMYWNITRVDWKTNPRLWGQQQQGSKLVDFGGQCGIYILYDRDRVIYVGRAIDQPLGQRLSQHMKDRLNGRWDRFSWFGLRRVTEDGELGPSEFTASREQIISLMEVILIEALEPPLNRKRGDDFSEREFLQVEDPTLKHKSQKAVLERLMAQLSS